jgi:hypothetical protein
MAATAGLSITLDPINDISPRKNTDRSDGHLGFSIGIKNRKFVQALPMIIPGQFGFN